MGVRGTWIAFAAIVAAICIGAFAAGPAGAQEDDGQIRTTVAVATMQDYIAQIDVAHQQMVDLYDLNKAPVTLLRAFQAKGVRSSDSAGLAKNWGENAVFWAWHTVEPYYFYHRDVLAESLVAIQASGRETVPGELLFYFDLGMQAWRQHEQTVRNLMSNLLAHRAEAALRYQTRSELNDSKWRLPNSEWASFDDRLNDLQTAGENSIDLSDETGRRLSDIGQNLQLFSPLEAIVPASEMAASQPSEASCSTTGADPGGDLGLLSLDTPPEIPEAALP